MRISSPLLFCSLDKSKIIDIIKAKHMCRGGAGVELDEKKIPVIFKALCDENRVKILKYLRSGEKCACRLLDDLNIAQSTLSHHMKILTDSGLVTGRKEGKWMHYSISKEGFDVAARYLSELNSVEYADNEKPCC